MKQISEINLTDKEKHILLHSLGLTTKKVPYRNHFYTGVGSKDYDDCESLVSKDLMHKRSDPFNDFCKDNYYYVVTKEGFKLLRVKYEN